MDLYMKIRPPYKNAIIIVPLLLRLLFQRGGESFVSFESKTNLIDHYIKSLGAYHFGGQLMVIDTLASKRLVDKYFKP